MIHRHVERDYQGEKARAMERTEWLKQMRDKAETLYNYVVKRWGFETDEEAVKSRDETTTQYIQKLLGYMGPQSNLSQNFTFHLTIELR